MGLVILGHAVAETSYQSPFYRGYVLIFRWISVFHMPAFFILSGMLFSREKWEGKSLTAYVKRKAVSLLVPYFAFEGIAIILQVYILGIKELKTALINTLICRSNLGADWFLPTLFAASVILFLISKTDKRIVQVLTGIVFISAAAFCSAEIHIQLVAGRCFIASFFMIIGYSFRRLLDQRINLVLCFFFFCLTILIAVINGQVGMYEIEMHNIILFIAGAVLGTTVIINVSKRFSIPACTRAGRDSLVIMGTHQHIIYIVRLTIKSQA